MYSVNVLNKTVLQAEHGETLLNVLISGGVFVDAPCGGRGVCGKCKVRLVSGEVDGAVDANGDILACHARVVGDITISLYDYYLTDSVKACDSVARSFSAGVALDIGTTTVCAELVNLDSGEVVENISVLNPQRTFGADVISRINAAKQGKTNKMHTAIVQCISGIVEGFKKRYSLPCVKKMCVSANTTMLHLLANIDPSAMGVVPFTPTFTESKAFNGAELGIAVDKVELLPSFSAFVGADVVAGLASIDIEKHNTALFIDLGTNGEIALAHNGQLFVCSTATGPCLEGAGISCGMGGVSGAVDSVYLDKGKICYTTIGNQQPLGICGSGLIDAVALMLRQGIIDETGAFIKGENYNICNNVSITPKDIRQFQLAKSAIMSGIKVLLSTVGIDYSCIEAFYIAGGLGFYINKQNACLIGLLPTELLDKTHTSGNLSLAGAKQCLLSPHFINKCNHLTAISKQIDLASNPTFQDEFVENILF